MRWRALLIAVFLLAPASAWCWPRGAASSSAPTDGISALAAQMTSGQFAQLSYETADGGAADDLIIKKLIDVSFVGSGTAGTNTITTSALNGLIAGAAINASTASGCNVTSTCLGWMVSGITGSGPYTITVTCATSPCVTANYTNATFVATNNPYLDGGHTWDNYRNTSTTTVAGPDWGTMNGIGCAPATALNTCLGYSRAALDETDWLLGYFGGGHVDGGDGSVYTHDINGSAQAIASYVAGGGSFASANSVRKHVVLALKSARFVPGSMTQPANATSEFFAAGVWTTTTGTVTAGSTTITLSDCNWTGMKTGGTTWVGGAGIADYSYIVSGSDNCPSGPAPYTATLANTYLPASSIVTANETNTPLRITINYWSVPSYDGLSMPISSHSYLSNTWVRGTSEMVLGGEFAFDNPGGGNAALDYSVADLKADTLSVNTSVGFSAQVGPQMTGVDYCSVDGKYYLWDSGTLYRVDNLAAGATKAAVWPVTGSASPLSNTEGTIIADPWNAGHCAFVEATAVDSGTTGQLGIISDIDGQNANGTGAAYHTATYDASLMINGIKNRSFTWDGTDLDAWDGEAAIIGIAPSTGSVWTVTRISASSPTGDVPALNTSWCSSGDGESAKIWDTGASHGHALLMWLGCGASFRDWMYKR